MQEEFNKSKITDKDKTKKSLFHKFFVIFSNLFFIGFSGVVIIALIGFIVLVKGYSQLPNISELSDYKPNLPLRVYSSEGILIGEFGEEKRHFLKFEQIPQDMINAILAAEDEHFFQHNGVDYKGLIRSALANLNRKKSQGASTITMQVARNTYVSSEKTYFRKFYEILLSFKLEHLFSKEQILEIYMNQIFLGHRSYGFAAASEVYFGKKLEDCNLAEFTMLAGIPKAPSTFNPIRNPSRAKTRQIYVVNRMLESGFINEEQAKIAKETEFSSNRKKLTKDKVPTSKYAEYVAEMARQFVYHRFGEDIYSLGLNIYTTIEMDKQQVAYESLRRGLINYEVNQHYRGPEGFVSLPATAEELDEIIDEVLNKYPDNGDILTAIVLSVNQNKILVVRPESRTIEISGKGLIPVTSGLKLNAPENIKIKAGSIIRIVQNVDKTWSATQIPEVEGAFISMNPKTGKISSLIGGFDFHKNKFNHVTQALRQPGSAFKPFIYSAALEKKIGPATIINDAEIIYETPNSKVKYWSPRNFSRNYLGEMSLRTALAKSQNIPAVKTIEFITPQFAKEWSTKFGFESKNLPAYLPLALGAASVSPLQMLTAYSVFANGGYFIKPVLIQKITTREGKILFQQKEIQLNEKNQVIPERNAFIMNSLLNTVTRSGTAARISSQLNRRDLYGKTGTTNDSKDAWFAGFHPNLVAVSWAGYDNPKKLGSRVTGGSLALPIWIDFMSFALSSTPTIQYVTPKGLTNLDNEWFYNENVGEFGIQSIGMDNNLSSKIDLEELEENIKRIEKRNKILELFSN